MHQVNVAVRRRAGFAGVLSSLLGKGFLCALFLGFAALNAAEPAKPTVVSKEYLLSPGDQIIVQVFGEADLSKTYSVSESGKIAFPLVGDLKVASLNTRSVERLLAKELKKGFLLNPKVNVTVQTYRQVFVNGQVKSPSGYPYLPGMTARKLITLAGGFTERASKRRIYVIGEGSSDSRKIKLDAEVRPGDIITVEESFF